METSSSGLEGIQVCETVLSDVDGDAGALTLRGYRLEELAGSANFEAVIGLMWDGALLPVEMGKTRLEAFDRLDRLGDALSQRDGMDALRAAIGHVPADGADREAMVRVTGAMPVFAAAWARSRRGLPPIAPDPALSHAADYLRMVSGNPAPQSQGDALDAYLCTVVDHGLNASTFTCRVITSTGSDLVSAVVGAIGALKGPLHGGAPGPALETVFEIGDASRAEATLRRKIEQGERLMGFGHRVYRVRDPRADVLAAAAERLYTRAGDMRLYRLARDVEATALRLLEEYKPGRRLQTNVEFYTALVLHGLGLDVPLFTPTFAISRVSGWIAHALEQRAANRLIRPRSEYIGPRDRRWR